VNSLSVNSLRTILFDLGNVLLPFSHEKMYAQIGRLCGHTPEQVRELLDQDGLADAFECGRVSEDEFHRQLESRSKTSISIDDLRIAAGDIFTINAAMREALPVLRDRGLRLVLLSNTNVTHIEWVRRQFDLLEFFDALVLSCEVGAMKPDVAIYKAALDAIECPPEHCFYTDDIPAYVDAGRSHGLQAEVFEGAETFRRHLADRGIEV